MTKEHHSDALVVGLGFSGIYALYSLVREGLSVKAIDTASDVGGTWYWNKYPGAMSDTWSHVYRYSFDKDLLLTYPWSRWYVNQPEALAYLRYAVDRYKLRDYMQFDTRMESAVWDEQDKLWRVRCNTGDVFCVRYLVTSLGLLNRPKIPDIPGASTFKGTITHTFGWDPELNVEAKRVGVIGTGSSGIQVVTAIAGKVKSLSVFIRRPQYSVPSGNRLITIEERNSINKKSDQIWTEARASMFAMGFPEPMRNLLALAPDDRERLLEDLWRGGNGLRFMMGSFTDILTDRAANEEVCRFIRKKIAGIVRDPQKLAVLTPKEPYARRPLCDEGYYEQFNRDNVFAVDAMKHPITEITPDGIRLDDGTIHELDIIVYATGFEAMDGSYRDVEIIGRGDAGDLRAKWDKDCVKTYMGLCVSGYPNLLMLNGPNTGFANVPPLTETNVDFMVDLVRRAEQISTETGTSCEIEATEETERWWTDICTKLAKDSIFTQTPSWFFGQNIPGKAFSPLLYLGGLGRFRGYLADIKARGFAGFKPPYGSGDESSAAV